MTLFYTTKFYDRDYERTSKSAAAVVPYLVDGLVANGAPALQSVLDIGCGRGVWLKAFADAGVDHVEGRDGPWTRTDRLLIPPAQFTVTDLSQTWSSPRRYDLAMTLEVAEHIDASQAEIFVDNIVAVSDTILFSAAIRGQGGQYHVNEQPLSYWLEKFAARGYALYDVIRPRFWNDQAVCWWYRQNIVLLCNDNSPYKYALQAMRGNAGPIIDVAHPQGFAKKAKLASIFAPEEFVGLKIAQFKKRLFV